MLTWPLDVTASTSGNHAGYIGGPSLNNVRHMSVLSKPAPQLVVTLFARLLLLTALLFPMPSLAQDTGRDSGEPGRTAILAELDAFWAEVARTVGEGDFDGYAATYHDDAVLVSHASGVSYPIATALSGWKPDFDRTRAGDISAGVSFRLTERLVSATTAHEKGLFRYRMDAPDSDPVDAIVHFEALLVKKDGHWLMLMERQMHPGTEAEWQAAGAP